MLWFRRRRRVEAPRIGSRDQRRAAARVGLAELVPPAVPFLAQCAYLQLAFFESLGRVVAIAPTTAGKEVGAHAAGAALRKHEALVAELRRRGEDPAVAMEPYRARIEEFQRRTRGNDWFESLLTSHLTAGLLDDFFLELATGLPGELGERVVSALAADRGEEGLAALLREGIEANERLASRLALWGRRLVGDTILVARAAIVDGDHDADAPAIEPAFTELIAGHTRRMDALGLTA